MTTSDTMREQTETQPGRKYRYLLANPRVVRKRLQNLLWNDVKARTEASGEKRGVVAYLGDIALDTGIDLPVLHEIVLGSVPPKGYPNAFVLVILAKHYGTTVESIMEHPHNGLQQQPRNA